MSVTIAVGVAIFCIAALYASVGHGGATAYLAVLSLLSFSPLEMRSTALVLNVLVAGLASIAYFRNHHLSLPLLWPFMVFSVPAAYLGGLLHVSTQAYTLLLSIALLAAALRLALTRVSPDTTPLSPPPARTAMPIGAGIGFLSGVIGIGGGVFLSPLLLVFRWANAKQAAAIAAPFIVVNSLAGIAGLLTQGGIRIAGMAPWVAAAALGAMIGAQIGARYLSHTRLCQVLAAVLVIASIKLCLPLLLP